MQSIYDKFSNLLTNIVLMVGIPLPLLLLIPVAVALAFQIIKTSESNTINDKVLSVKNWNGEKSLHEKHSNIATLLSLIFIVFASFAMYNANSGRPLFSLDYTNIM